MYQDSLVGVPESECFWTRGLVPLGWTVGVLPPVESKVWAWGSLHEALREGVPIRGGIYGSDASGGEHTKDWRLRRCGWSVVHLQPGSLQ
eukprot:3710162-Pyramimonas_sp.AAC.1